MLTLQELERLAYISGDMVGAALLANAIDRDSEAVLDLDYENRQLQERIDELETEVASLGNEVARLELGPC